MKLPVIKAFSDTFSLVFGNLPKIFRIAWLPVLALTAGFTWILPQYVSAVSKLAVLGEKPDPQQVMAIMGPLSQWAALIFLLTLVFSPMLHAGLLRFAIRGQRASGFFYLRFGGDELRIILTSIVWFIAYMAAVLLATLACVLLVMGAGMVSQPAAGIVGFIAGTAAIIFIIWVVLRLSLSIPASVGAEKIGVGPSWSAAKGNVWSLLGYWLLWYLFFLVIEAIAFAFLMPSLMGEFSQLAAAGNDPQAVEQAMALFLDRLATFFDYRNPIVLVGMVIGYLIGVIIYALYICAGGVAYRLMTEGEGSGETEA